METLKTYVAADGMKFDDRFMCAQHELVSKPELLQKLHDAFYNHTYEVVSNWCGGDPETRDGGGFGCACMGCANHAFYDLGLRYEHWKVWIDVLRKPAEDDGISRNTDVDLILVNPGPNRIEVFKAVRGMTGLGIVETKKIVDTPNSQVKCYIEQYEAKHCGNKLKDLGAEIKIVVSDKQRWTVITPGDRDYGFGL